MEYLECLYLLFDVATIIASPLLLLSIFDFNF